jgi:hypothetical protein
LSGHGKAHISPVEVTVMADVAVRAPNRFSGLLLMSAIAGGLLIVATLGLWAHYGTTVFFEMIVAGVANCL